MRFCEIYMHFNIDPLEIQHPKLKSADTVRLSLFMRDNGKCDIPRLLDPGLSETMFPNKGVELYSPKGTENVRENNLYRCTG